ncbi:hypothetical protein NLN94_09205 [Citrobacter portucalensis]|uniref:hypothetical protein n=1 Tax=Citrobacter portucalensis TaxID=1639133 RepID=UPI00226B76EA|nr:hypothetical protein [Citrobacter portucalensis]MCX9039272.1 hypothetical protein [Citrobacter portucalensis]MCX9061108.1 hypothetical protein [Citrobacter portucalensis]
MKAIFLTLTLGLCAGWLTRGWHQDSVELAITRTAQQTREQLRDDLVALSTDSSRQLEQKLEGLKNAAPVEIRTEIVKPVFTNVCVTADFVRMYNAAAGQAERALSGKPADALPGRTPQATGGKGP